MNCVYCGGEVSQSVYHGHVVCTGKLDRVRAIISFDLPEKETAATLTCPDLCIICAKILIRKLAEQGEFKTSKAQPVVAVGQSVEVRNAGDT